MIEEKSMSLKINLFLVEIASSISVHPHETLVVGWTFGVYGAVSLRILQLK